MSYTINWNIETPIEGALDWNIRLNNNFISIDTILQSLRTNFSATLTSTGPETHNPIGSLWYSLLQNPGEGMFVKKTTGYTQLLDEEKADKLYATIEALNTALERITALENKLP